MLALDTAAKTLRTVQVKGQQPGPRAYHSSTAVAATGKIYLLGGRNDTQYCMAAVLDCVKVRWSADHIHGAAPPAQAEWARSSHAAIPITISSDDYILVCGGQHGDRRFADIGYLKVCPHLYATNKAPWRPSAEPRYLL